MAFKDSLEAVTAREKSTRCRVCTLISEMPEPDATALAHAARRGSGVALKDVVDALAEEGHPDMFNPMRHHRYSCPNA